MLDKSIDGALLALRAQIIRGDGAGLEHVEALLALRGVHMPRVLPAKASDAAKRGHMRRLVLGALREGPKTMGELVACVSGHRPGVPVQRRTEQAMYKLKMAGLVGREDRAGRYVWGLAP